MVAASENMGADRAGARQPSRYGLRPGARTAALFGAALAAAATAVLPFFVPIVPAAEFVLRAAAYSILTGAIVFRFWDSDASAAQFGPANRVTAVRALTVAVLAALAGQAPGALLGWAIVVAVIALLILDGVDGHLARSRGQVSAFGARFDMETDAALMLVLAVLVWQFGRAGPWILAVGLMRYAFVAAGWAIHWMRNALPYRRRRQVVCVVQLIGLLLMLAPVVPARLATVIGVATLALLTLSFAIDVRWLFANRDQAMRKSPSIATEASSSITIST